MRRLFAAAGVDFVQWKALTQAMLKIDFRTSSVGAHPAQQSSSTGALLMQLVFYSIAGLGMAFLLAVATELFLSATIAMTMMMVLIGTAVLLDHNSAIASPSDYGVLGFRPISSRTYFAVRLTNVLVYTSALTTVAAWMPVTALFIRYGAVVGVTGIAAFYACATSTTLAILIGYASTLRLVGPNAVKRVLSYVQLAMSALVYGGSVFMSRVITRKVVSSLAVTKTPWLLLFPATWFAAYLELASGKRGLTELIPAVVSVLAIAAMASGLKGRLSLDYSERLGAMLTATAQPSASERRRGRRVARLFTAGEARGVALLVRSQFHSNQPFRLGVLSILPLTLLYVFIGARDGALTDPFLQVRRGPSLVAIAVMMFPSGLKTHLTRSEGFRASWIFFVCPIDRMKILRASKDVLVAFFLLPYLVFLTAVYAYMAGSPAHVAVHMALLGLLSHLALQITFFLDPALPFSRPPAQKGQNSMAFIAFMVGVMILSNVLQAFSATLYSSTPATVTAFVVVLVASVGVDRVTRVRVARQAATLEFEG